MKFDEILQLALSKMNPKTLNKRAKIADAICVIVTKNDNIFIGASLVASCGLGYCAEQSCISQMLTFGESAIDSMLIVDKFGTVLTPCGKCIELITQINEENLFSKVLVSSKKFLYIKDLFPFDWKKTKDGLISHSHPSPNEDKFNLKRFLDAQKNVYFDALHELMNGKKETHWMWFVFPQLKSLGHSEKSIFYGIESVEEAKAYFDNKVLSWRYIESCKVLLNLAEKNICNIFGQIDALKLKSSLTLFEFVDTDNKELYCSLFKKFFNGERYSKTLAQIN